MLTKQNELAQVNFAIGNRTLAQHFQDSLRAHTQTQDVGQCRPNINMHKVCFELCFDFVQGLHPHGAMERHWFSNPRFCRAVAAHGLRHTLAIGTPQRALSDVCPSGSIFLEKEQGALEERAALLWLEGVYTSCTVWVQADVFFFIIFTDHLGYNPRLYSCVRYLQAFFQSKQNIMRRKANK